MKKNPPILIILVVSIIIIIGSFFIYEKYFKSDDMYISILEENKMDFEYVAKEMEQWQSGWIGFESNNTYDNAIIINNHVFASSQNIVDGVANDDDFYASLMRIYELDAISCVMIEGNEVIFYFSNPPAYYRGGFVYSEKIETDSISKEIDEHWMLRMIPNI